MIAVLDGNYFVHLFWHMAASTAREDTGDAEAQPEIADVLDWFMIRLDNIRDYLLSKDPDTECVCVFDSTRASFRRGLLDEYKANRTRIAGVVEAVRDAKIAVTNSDEWVGYIAPDGYEADDVIASLAYQSTERVLIHSADKDLNQCLERGRVSIMKRSSMEPTEPNDHGIMLDSELRATYYTSDMLEREFGFAPDRWVDYQCLVGDSADNVAGAKWIGPVAAKRILAHGLPIEDIEKLGLNKRQAAEWPAFLERLDTLREVFTLRTDLELERAKNGNGERQVRRGLSTGTEGDAHSAMRAGRRFGHPVF